MSEEAAALWKRFGGAERRPDHRFDPDFYLARHKDVREAGVSPADHYRWSGEREGRAGNAFAAAVGTIGAQTLRDEVLALLTDETLRDAVARDVPGALEVAFELIALGHPIDAAVSDFSKRHYLESHRDIAGSGLDPLFHYVRYGHAEGRATLASIRANVYPGARAFDPARPTVLIGSHELSETGAPMVALGMAGEAAQGHNVVVMAGRGGALLDAFREASCGVIVTEAPHVDWSYFGLEALGHVHAAVLNSVESWRVIPALVARGVPFASYVHEFHNYILPSFKAKLTALFARKIAFSSAMVRQSWDAVLRDVGFDVEGDSMLIAQDSLAAAPIDMQAHAKGRRVLSELIGVPCEGRRVIYGAGQMQIRKGTDLFAMTAQQVRAMDPTALFVWIGDGANPEDIHFGVWLDKHLEEAGANEPGSNLHTVPAGPYYADVCAAADVLFLSSRLDPLPNVVFDAAKRGTTVVMFRGATGFDDERYANEASLVRVGYGDLSAAAEALLSAPVKTTRRRWLPIWRRGENAPESPPVFAPIRERLPDGPPAEADDGGPDAFDVSLLFGSGPRQTEFRRRERALLRRYGRLAIWSDVAQAEALLAEQGGWMHERTRIVEHSELAPDDAALADLPPVSIHVHAHYLDGLAEDMRLPAYGAAARVVVTTDTDEKGERIERIAADAGLTVDVRVVPNQGRDVLPFLRVVAEDRAGDDAIWCHVHQKKSIGSSLSGDVWRAFLMRLTLGCADAVSSALAEIARPDVGLVSAFDPHIMGWSASARLVPDVERRIGRNLPPHPLVFPVGQMLWTRAGVARRLFGLFGPDYPWPNEPLPNDGTIYHMIERLWPAASALDGRGCVFLSNPDVRRTP